MLPTKPPMQPATVLFGLTARAELPFAEGPAREKRAGIGHEGSYKGRQHHGRRYIPQYHEAGKTRGYGAHGEQPGHRRAEAQAPLPAVGDDGHGEGVHDRDKAGGGHIQPRLRRPFLAQADTRAHPGREERHEAQELPLVLAHSVHQLIAAHG